MQSHASLMDSKITALILEDLLIQVFFFPNIAYSLSRDRNIDQAIRGSTFVGAHFTCK